DIPELARKTTAGVGEPGTCVDVLKEAFRGERPFVLRVLIQRREHAHAVLHEGEVCLLVLDSALGIEREPVVAPRDLLSHFRVEPPLQLGSGRDRNRPGRDQDRPEDQHPDQRASSQPWGRAASRPSYDRALWALRFWLFDDRSRRATFYTAGVAACLSSSDSWKHRVWN